ncbi:nucleoside diphosphate kinase [Papiliotrema laurentii]|uniref:Nucleoside diphosphate kinase n=1 Tax=Papiliotrema laurentii TaxID=5418 RepID=A0AAD9FLC0_PAPLA|nr:nucleoside diphosphate kinase [Papiliotrema laurentii]
MFRISTQTVWALCDAKSRRGPTWISLSFGSEPTVHTNKPKKPLKMSKTDQTYIMVKPDGVQRGLVGEIISRFEKRGLKLVALKMDTPSQEQLEKHYADLKNKPFFPSLIKYMLSGPVVCMVWEGLNAFKVGRAILGATNPQDSAPGTIRGDFCMVTGANVCHGSDGNDSAAQEIALWFPEGVKSYEHTAAKWIYE